MIDSRALTVMYRRVQRREGLLYAQQEGASQAQRDPVFKDVHLGQIQQDIKALREKVRQINRLALGGKLRGDLGVEVETERLSNHTLPPGGFCQLHDDGSHPRLDTYMDIAAEIPWEALDEACLICDKGHRMSVPSQKDLTVVCPLDGTHMKAVRRKLVEDYHLTHKMFAGTGPASGGKRFLFILDPRKDLLAEDHDPQGICRAHWEELRVLLTAHDFEVDICRDDQAKVNVVLDRISDPEVAGIYYFGHAEFSEDDGEGRLWLADGEVYAAEIEERAPRAKLVFLNGCMAGAQGGADDLADRKPRGVAQAFARGHGRVVIAPTFRVVNTHAATMALRFFREAMGRSLGEAMHESRRLSLRAYREDGAPDISWLAYRYFGDPNFRLAPAKEEPVRPKAPSVAVVESPVFDASGQLKVGAFSFALMDVLTAATSRCREQQRSRLTPMDFLVGMIHKGDLTRFVFQQEGVQDLDALCESLRQRPDTEPAGLARVLPDDRVPGHGDFRDELVAILGEASKRAGEGNEISEQIVLEVFTVGGHWAVQNDLGLPSATRLSKRLVERDRGGVDDNGLISLRDLDTAARSIIESAHVLAQQRGMADIPHRLMMASLVGDASGFGARVCRCAGVSPELLCMVMIALLEGDDAASNSRQFGLSSEVCRRIVTPVLDKARELAPKSLIGEEHLFRAFCEVANPGFKEWIAGFSADLNLEGMELGKVDLDDLALIDPAFWEKTMKGLDPDARKIVRAAHSLAQNCGVDQIRNRLLLAAFVSRPEGLLSSLLRRHHVSTETFRAQLIAASDTGSQRKFALDQRACAWSLQPLLDKARELAGVDAVTESLLFRVFCQLAPEDLKRTLRTPIWGVDLDALAKEALEAPPPKDSAGPESPQDNGASAGKTDTNWEPHPFRTEQFDGEAWRALEESSRLAREQGWAEVRTPHLLAALIDSGSESIVQMLRQLPVGVKELKERIKSMLPSPPPSGDSGPVRMGAHTSQLVSYALQFAAQQGHTKASGADLLVAMCAENEGPIATLLRGVGIAIAPVAPGGAPGFPNSRPRSALATFGVDLTEKARLGQLPEIVGRDEEINTALQTLLLLENASPLLVGESGVGKTAIVEGIAKRIAQGPCPKRLQEMRLIELSAGSLVANTRLRGEFEQRIQDVLAEARENVILFIDEIHTIVGAGSAEGSGPDAGNMLKTALARGEIRLIGATTHAEFKRTIARDKALSRRFQSQMIGPPSREATIQVLTARQAALEKHHEVKIAEEAKLAAVDLSGRYIVDKQWPAKARDVLERACVLAVVEGEPAETGSAPIVTAEHVARVIFRWTGVPMERLSAGDWQLLAGLEQRLGSRIVGQPEAIRTVADAIRRGRQAIASRNRPWGVFLFVGPPGVGKTELARVIAEEVFGGTEGLIRFDMGDFSEPHSTAKLIGSPPGYIGYDQGAPLVERLRTHPYSLLLFDEIEHAHENVLAVLLRFLSEGTLSDPDGQIADGRNCIVVLTSNLLAPGGPAGKMGFSNGASSNGQSDLRVLLERQLPRKLIDRLDSVVQFNALTADDLQVLVAREVADRQAQAAVRHSVSITVDPAVLAWLTARVARVGQGARAVRRAVDDHFGSLLAAYLGQAAQSQSVLVSVSPDGATLVIVAVAAEAAQS